MPSMGYIGFEVDGDGFITARGSVADAETVMAQIREDGIDVPSDWEPTEREVSNILDLACDYMNVDGFLDEALFSLVTSSISRATRKVYDARQEGA